MVNILSFIRILLLMIALQIRPSLVYADSTGSGDQLVADEIKSRVRTALRIKEKLGLNKKQIVKLRELTSRHRTQSDVLNGEVVHALDQLKGALDRNADEKELNLLVADVRRCQRRIEDLTTKQNDEMMDLLSPIQKTKFI